jgi:hypothetical protein
MPALLLLLWTSFSSAQEPLTNLQLIERALKTMMQEAEPHLVLADSSLLCFASPAERPAWDWLVEKAVYDHLAAKHDISLRRVDAASLEMPQLFYVPMELKIRYETAAIAKRKVVRRATCRLYLKSQDAQGRIIFAQEMTNSSVDTLAGKLLPSLEDKSYAFTIGERAKASWLKRMLEPLIVTVITGGIIYLFYSFRSN